MFHIVLVEPEIPPNTGNVIRLAANTGCSLHLVEPLGFSMDDRHMRRAGLDYHEYAPCAATPAGTHSSTPCSPAPARLFALTTRGTRQPARGGLPHRRLAGVRRRNPRPGAGRARAQLAPAQQLRLPMRAGQRSLNLSNAVAVTVFEAWRQNGFAGA
jgi:tRNA (cytidine/uridine-2'-O-)-methyltransferase